ncbi:MAG: hypothetical protein P794_03745 [Epsilonproteobacteria bacterium (ex Lamellibrachia satsuma)]|nr:MAG: hypothetical protein P794_03745 [Epsilonproteobacteria bacterium (ex Lamellibrachia satsuma)]
MVSNEEEAIRAYINKPESEAYYINAFKAYENNGIAQFRWYWSWWAFFGGVFFLLYRKLYVEAAVFFLIGIMSSRMPIASFIIWIASGGIFIYFVYKRYKKIKAQVDANISNPSEQLQALRELGGYNQWAVWVAVALNVLLIGFIIYAVSVYGALGIEEGMH